MSQWTLICKDVINDSKLITPSYHFSYSIYFINCRKSKKKDKKKLLKEVSKMVESVEKETQKPQNEFELTQAEIAFKKQQEKMVSKKWKKIFIQIWHLDMFIMQLNVFNKFRNLRHKIIWRE